MIGLAIDDNTSTRLIRWDLQAFPSSRVACSSRREEETAGHARLQRYLTLWCTDKFQNLAGAFLLVADSTAQGDV
jgi:hypothetical protein